MAEDGVMDPVDTVTLAHLLTVAALLAGTCEYGEIIRRREERRQGEQHQLVSAGLIRRRLERMTGARLN
jgi:hypothetical protein